MALKNTQGPQNKTYQSMLRRPNPRSIPPFKTAPMLDAQDPRHASPELPAMGGNGVGRVLHSGPSQKVTCPSCGTTFVPRMGMSQSPKGPTQQ